MKRNALWLAVAGLVVGLTACGQGEVDIRAEVEQIDPETGETTTQPLGDLPVQLLPFDRDRVFDSLSAAHPEPEPELDPEIEDAREEMQEYQNLWREAEREWVDTRAEMQRVREEMDQYAPAESAYQELFARFETLEAEYEDAEERKDEYFERFTSLQDEIFDELDAFRLELEAWEDEAFRDYPEVVAELQDARGREVIHDTTDASGHTRLVVRPGEWWVHARHRMPQRELYWNVPVELERGEPGEVILSVENAEERTVF